MSSSLTQVLNSLPPLTKEEETVQKQRTYVRFKKRDPLRDYTLWDPNCWFTTRNKHLHDLPQQIKAQVAARKNKKPKFLIRERPYYNIEALHEEDNATRTGAFPLPPEHTQWPFGGSLRPLPPSEHEFKPRNTQIYAMAYNSQPTYRFLKQMQYQDKHIPLSSGEYMFRTDSRYYRQLSVTDEAMRAAKTFERLKTQGNPALGMW